MKVEFDEIRGLNEFDNIGNEIPMLGRKRKFVPGIKTYMIELERYTNRGIFEKYYVKFI